MRTWSSNAAFAADDRRYYDLPHSAAYLDSQVQRLSETLRQLLWGEHTLDDDAVRTIIQHYASANPRRCGLPRCRTAIHEAGHAIAFEVTGCGCYQIKLFRGVHLQAWSGIAIPFTMPPLQPQYCDAEGALVDAIFTLSGPMAEELHGNGVATASIGEILGARACVTRAAELSGLVDADLWHSTLEHTAFLLHANEAVLDELTSLLMTKTKVSCHDRVAKRLFSLIRPGNERSLPYQYLSLIDGLTCTPAFLSEVRI